MLLRMIRRTATEQTLRYLQAAVTKCVTLQIRIVTSVDIHRKILYTVRLANGYNRGARRPEVEKWRPR